MIYINTRNGRRLRSGLGDLNDPAVAYYDDPTGQPQPGGSALQGLMDGTFVPSSAPAPSEKIQLAQIQANADTTKAEVGFFSSLATGLANAGASIGAAFISNNKGEIRPNPAAIAPRPTAPAPSSGVPGWVWGVGAAAAAIGVAVFARGRQR